MNEHDLPILAKEGIYKGKPLCAKLEETHISWILLTDDLVFKIKKPVKLSFLDFSQLTTRKALCEKELLLNKRFSPIYLNVLAVNQTEKGFEIGGEHGKPVDYTVVMKRLPSEKKMDQLLSLRKITGDAMVTLAEKIVALHRNAQIVLTAFDPKEQTAIFNDIENMRLFISKHFTADYLAMIDHAIAFSDAFIHEYTGRMAERVWQGFKRDGHGDLHSGNIFIDKEPVIFDCIEYNDAFRQIDVLSDIAFLCMDLEASGQKLLSEIFLTSYCDQFPAFEETADNLIFLYYKCMRANIRAKVNTVSAMESERSESFQGYLETAGKYLRLMNEYVVQIQQAQVD